MQTRERPGVSTPWPGINQLLSPGERFATEGGYLLAPKSAESLAAAAYTCHQEGIAFTPEGRAGSRQDEGALVFSTRYLKAYEFGEGFVRAGSAVLIQDLQAEALKMGRELCLDLPVHRVGKLSVGTLVERGEDSGRRLSALSTPGPLLGAECVSAEGALIRLGKAALSPLPGPQCYLDLWGGFDSKLIVTELIFRSFPRPQVRLSLQWKFSEREQLMDFMYKLQDFSGDWERLDCVISGTAGEKAFLLAEISGSQAEMEAFQRCCPGLKDAEAASASSLKSYLAEGFRAQKGAWEDLGEGRYLWYHALTGDLWCFQ